VRWRVVRGVVERLVRLRREVLLEEVVVALGHASTVRPHPGQ
jgi:hypothetical protein